MKKFISTLIILGLLVGAGFFAVSTVTDPAFDNPAQFACIEPPHNEVL